MVRGVSRHFQVDLTQKKTNCQKNDVEYLSTLSAYPVSEHSACYVTNYRRMMPRNYTDYEDAWKVSLKNILPNL